MCQLTGQCLGRGTASPALPFLAGAGGFLPADSRCRSCVPASVLASSAKILEGAWPRCPSIPGKPCAGQGRWLPSQPRPGRSCISLPGPWAVGSKQGRDPALGEAPLQAWPAKVMLSQTPPVCPAFRPVQAPRGWQGSWDGAACVASPASPWTSLTLLPSPWPAVCSPQEQQISVLFYPSFALFHKVFCRLFGRYKSSHAG